MVGTTMTMIEGILLGIVYVVCIAAEGLGASMIGPERTYWPVLRLQKATIASALTWYLSIAVLSNLRPGILSTIVANAGGVVLVMLDSLWSLYLIWRRNRVPAFLPIDLAGVPQARRLDYETLLREVDSSVRHAIIEPEHLEGLQRDMDRLRAMTPEERAIVRERAMAQLRKARERQRQRRKPRNGIE